MLIESIEFAINKLLEIAMKRTTVTLPMELVEDLLEVAPAKNKTQAIMAAIQECIKRKKLEKIKSLAGRGRWHTLAKA
jgi:hypothetical protein